MLTDPSGAAARRAETASSAMANRCPWGTPRIQAKRGVRSGPKLANWATFTRRASLSRISSLKCPATGAKDISPPPARAGGGRTGKVLPAGSHAALDLAAVRAALAVARAGGAAGGAGRAARSVEVVDGRVIVRLGRRRVVVAGGDGGVHRGSGDVAVAEADQV